MLGLNEVISPREMNPGEKKYVSMPNDNPSPFHLPLRNLYLDLPRMLIHTYITGLWSLSPQLALALRTRPRWCT